MSSRARWMAAPIETVHCESAHAELTHVPSVNDGPGGCFGIIQLFAGSLLLSHQPIIVLRILLIGFGSD
jgi:hypothetical protein